MKFSIMKNVKELFHSVMFNLSKVVDIPSEILPPHSAVYVFVCFVINQTLSFNMFSTQPHPLPHRDL